VKSNHATKDQLRKLFYGKYKAWIEDEMFIPNSLKKYILAGQKQPVTVKEWDKFFAWHFK